MSAHGAAQTESRFVVGGYAVFVWATERAAAIGDGTAAGFLTTLRQASPIALHRSATLLQPDRSPTFREHVRALQAPKALLNGDRSLPFGPPLLEDDVWDMSCGRPDTTCWPTIPTGSRLSWWRPWSCEGKDASRRAESILRNLSSAD